jgi:hypothetical protein
MMSSFVIACRYFKSAQVATHGTAFSQEQNAFFAGACHAGEHVSISRARQDTGTTTNDAGYVTFLSGGRELAAPAAISY